MEWPAFIFVLFFTCGNVFLRTAGYHTGAPADLACAEMTPGHGVAPQTGQSPYRVIMPKREWTNGEPVEIPLTSPTGGPPFKGFFIQIRAKGGDTPVGQFKPDSDPSIAQPVACGGKPNTGMTHKDSNLKTQVKLVWTPPVGDGEYVPMVTFVKQLDTFWMKEISAPEFKVTGGGVNPRGEASGSPSGNDSGLDPSEPPSQGAASQSVPFWGAIILVISTAFTLRFRM